MKRKKGKPEVHFFFGISLYVRRDVLSPFINMSETEEKILAVSWERRGGEKERRGEGEGGEGGEGDRGRRREEAGEAGE